MSENELSTLKNRVSHGDILLRILEFVDWDAKTISSYQQTCSANKEWKEDYLKGLKFQRRGIAWHNYCEYWE